VHQRAPSDTPQKVSAYHKYKGLTVTVCKRLLQFKNKKNQTTQFKYGQRSWLDISSKKTHKQLINTLKDTEEAGWLSWLSVCLWLRS